MDHFTLSASAQVVYSDLRGKVDPQLSGLVSWKNDAETVGVLLGGVYQKRRIRRDGIEGADKERQRASGEKREGNGACQEIQFQAKRPCKGTGGYEEQGDRDPDGGCEKPLLCGAF